MIAQAEALYRLQQIDLKVGQQRKRLKEIAVALEDNQSIVVAQAQVESAQKAVTPLRTKARDLELEIQSNVQKTKASEDRLYGGSVRNHKELQDLQSEIESLKKRKTALEDNLLEVMVAVEEAEAVLTTHQGELRRLTAEWEQQHGDLLQEKAAREAEVETLKQQRETALQAVTADSLAVYTNMRAGKVNPPVSAIEGGVCTVCGIELTMATVQETRHGQRLVYCPNCERILVVIGG